MVLVVSLAIITFAAAFHAYWAFGGRLGFSVSLPQQCDGTPVMVHRLSWWRPAAAAVAVALLALAALLLGRAHLLTLPLTEYFVRASLIGVGAAFVGRSLAPNRYVGFFKNVRTTRWAAYDTWLYSPLFLLLGLLVIQQAL